MNNLTPADLAQEVYDEEIALGMSPTIATFIADGVIHSPEYRAAWLAERSERLRESKEREEALLEELSYSGNPQLEEL